RLPRRVVFRALLRVGCFLDQAILLACRRVEALDYRALRAELLHRLPVAFGGNGGAVVALAILGDAAVGLGIRGKRHERERGENGEGSSGHCSGSLWRQILMPSSRDAPAKLPPLPTPFPITPPSARRRRRRFTRPAPAPPG